MARVQADLKAGYYPINTDHLPHIARLFTPGAGKILDPCAGEGAALAYLAQAWGMTPYANELNQERYAQCRERFGALQAVQGDLRQLRASRNAFGVVYCNPPYSLDATADKAHKRTEFQMLGLSWKWVQPGGICLWVVYDYHLSQNPHALDFLTYHAAQVDVYRLPGLHLKQYQQILVVARKRLAKLDPSADMREALAELTVKAENPRPITEVTKPLYELPTPPDHSRFQFAPATLTPDFALQAVEQAGVHLQNRFQKSIAPPPPETLERPITLPKAAQVLMLIVSGFTNGIVLELGDGRTVMVRGTIQRQRALTQQDEIVEPGSGQIIGRKQTFTTRPKSVVALLDDAGRIELLKDEADIVNFVETHREQLFDYVKTHHPPLYEFDYGGIRELVDGVRLPLKDEKSGLTELKPLFTTQRHMIAAAYTALQARHRVLISAEPGIGKSILGVTLAAAVGKDRQPGQVVMVMCPPQLTGKWKREIERAHGLPDRYAEILSRVDEVRDFMARAEAHPDVLHIGVMSREMAKLGSGWQHALHWQAVRQALWPINTPPPDELKGRERIATVYIPCCPTCAEPVRKAATGDLLSPGHFGYDPKTGTYDNQKRTRTQYHCRNCGGALYQITRLKGSQPGPGEKFPRHNPRMPLAEFIARVYPGRVALSIIDEVHQCKSLSADQGRAMTHLVNCSEKSVGLSGTIFGGLASSLYLLLFMFSHHVRTTYPFGSGGQQRFVENMGVLEEVIEDRPQYENGVYSGTKRYDSGVRESPGCSPRLVVETLPCTVFAGLHDIGLDMPELIETPVAITPDVDLRRAYDLGEQKLKDYLAGLRYTGKQWTFMGAYLQALMNYPDACADAYPVYHKEFDETVWTFPGLGEDQLYAKEEKLIDIVRQELEEGRKVTVFVRQTGKRDVQRRLAKLLTEHVPGAKPYIMYGGNNGGGSAEDGLPSASVPTQQREKALDDMLAKGRNVLICNPMLVETGLDLIKLPTIIFYELLFSLYPIDQASRRHWRIIQQQECRTYCAP
ncbi:MAG: DUF6094 domain-containing protein [Chloroflexi bacterium]|nr:DUF6094 domain-containing protein [Chloroflexota bacterium]